MSGKQYRVKLTCKVAKVVICEDCTREQAESDPFMHAVDEYETDQYDWQVESVEEESTDA